MGEAATSRPDAVVVGPKDDRRLSLEPGRPVSAHLQGVALIATPARSSEPWSRWGQLANGRIVVAVDGRAPGAPGLDELAAARLMVDSASQTAMALDAAARRRWPSTARPQSVWTAASAPLADAAHARLLRGLRSTRGRRRLPGRRRGSASCASRRSRAASRCGPGREDVVARSGAPRAGTPSTGGRAGPAESRRVRFERHRRRSGREIAGWRSPASSIHAR